jgi:UDP-N-acetylmuramoylalanine--D-glutamate ligase
MTGERDSLVGKRVTVIGLGIEGVDAARYAVAHGARVTVLDSKPEGSLVNRLRELEGLPITYALGRAQRAEDIAGSDLVIVSQSVPLTIPVIAEARASGIEITSMARRFLELCPGPTIGVTGSSGKTTTTSLVAAMVAQDGRPYRVGGNIGAGLLGLLDGIDEQTWTVLELSHNQLQLTSRSPHIAAITNITPNHLDQFSWEDYVALKQHIVRYQGEDDHVVLNADDLLCVAAAEMTPARRWWITMRDEAPSRGTYVRDGSIVLRRDRAAEDVVLPVGAIALRGTHNVANVLAAVAIGAAAGISVDDMAAAIRGFRAVEHRLEEVAEIDGVRWVNDSIATTPDRTLAGIRSFEEPLVLLLGGKDKDLPKEELAEEALRRCSAIVFFGGSGALFEAAVEAASATVTIEDRPQTVRVVTLAEAVEAARDMAGAGDVVLLSPAGTSFDAFNNFEERGEEFRALVLAMAGEKR